MSTNLSLFDGERLQMTESIELTIASILAYCTGYEHWAIAWSGGKDSTALVTLICWLIDAGKIPKPKSLTVFYADTRLELLPLWLSAAAIREELEERGVTVRVVMAPLDDRFMVYMLGRGVPPPNNQTFRWCTSQIKIEPMQAEIDRSFDPGVGVLMFTGVRKGESAARDQRIALSCSRGDGECGQGWYQKDLKMGLGASLAPILHWRVCHIWEWLKHWAPQAQFGDWSTELLAEAYGGDEAEENEARTGCVGCPLTEKDTALDSLLRRESWQYLAPLKMLRPLWRSLRLPKHRLRQPGGEKRKDGSLVANQQRMGPITLEARLRALDAVIEIQNQINTAAERLGRPRVDLVNAEEEARIRKLIELKTWPQKWDGSQPTADVLLEKRFSDGTSQPLLRIFGQVDR